MKNLNRQKLLENIIFATGWLLVFLTPILDSKLSKETSLNWRMVYGSWLVLLPFFIFFLIHNFFSVPKLFFRKKYLIYTIVSLLSLILIFTIYPGIVKWEFGKVAGKEFVEQHPGGFKEPPPAGFGTRPPGEFKERPPGELKERPPGENRPPFEKERFQNDKIRRKPTIDIRSLDSLFINILIAILIAGFNLAVKLFFRLYEEQNKQIELKNNNLIFELEYLKGQLNPHFFMNMLNNIHAMIDIDTERAKETIIGFSKLMRYVIYDANQPKISLSKEISFIGNYIDLMKIRFTENVTINVNLPESVPEIQIPPLLFVSFIENAFKHGVKAAGKSFVDISMLVVDGSIEYEITNSVREKNDEERGGIGLSNVIKRLDLLYGNRYSLNIEKNPEIYKVNLKIPII